MWPHDHNMGDEDGGSTMALKFLLPEVTHVTVTHSPLMKINCKRGRERKQQSSWDTYCTQISVTETKPRKGQAAKSFAQYPSLF